MALKLKKQTKIRLHVVKPAAFSKRRGIGPPVSIQTVNPEKYMGWREKQIWRKLSEKEKQTYLERAVREYEKEELRKGLAKESSLTGGGWKTSRGDSSPFVSAMGTKNASERFEDTQYRDLELDASEDRTEGIGNESQKVYGRENFQVMEGEGGGNRKEKLPVVPEVKVGQAASRITKKIVNIFTDATEREERLQERQKNQQIQKEVARQLKEDTKKAASGVGTVITMVFPQVRAVTAAAAPLLLAGALLLALFFGLVVTVTGIAAEQASSKGGGEQIVRVALKEEQEGPHEGGDKYWSWYGFGSRVEWCATFVSWSANECGYIDSGIVPKSASVSAFHQWYEEKGLYFTKEVYTPKAGDFIIFENGMSHIGIVQYVEEGQVVTIEGNTSDIVHSRSYPLDWYGISGYCSPKYPAESDFTGDTNAEICWNFLKSKGCSDAAAAGIMGSLYQESKIDPGSEQYGGGPGRGIAQWELGSNRFANLLEKAASMGMEWSDIEPQLEFLWDELSGGDATCKYIMDRDYGGLENFIKADNIHWATEAFERSFERAGTPAMENRYQYAESFYAQYAGN